MTSPHLDRPKPGLAFCILVPIVIWLIPAIVAVGLFVRGFTSFQGTIDDFARVEVGEQADVQLDTGDHRVWAESDGGDDSFYPSSVSMTIVSADGGDVVELEPYSVASSLSYSDGSRHGEAVHTFEITEAGLYTVEVTTAAPTVERVAIGTENPVAITGRYILAGIAVGSIGFLLAIIALIVFLVRRSRSKRRLASANAGFGPPGSFGPPGGFGPPPVGPPPAGPPHAGAPQAWTNVPPGGYPPAGPSA